MSIKILGKFYKQPTEILDFDVDYTDWFSNRTDTPDTFAVVAEPGITVVGSTLVGNLVKVILSGGTDGVKYKITVRLTTVAGLVKEADFTVTAQEV